MISQMQSVKRRLRKSKKRLPPIKKKFLRLAEFISAEQSVINPAGFSFNSIPVLDALKMFDGPVIEIHISNIHARDELHRHSILSTVTRTVICGAGAYGYNLALLAAVNALGLRPNALPDPLSTGPV